MIQNKKSHVLLTFIVNEHASLRFFLAFVSLELSRTGDVIFGVVFLIIHLHNLQI